MQFFPQKCLSANLGNLLKCQLVVGLPVIFQILPFFKLISLETKRIYVLKIGAEEFGRVLNLSMRPKMRDFNNFNHHINFYSISRSSILFPFNFETVSTVLANFREEKVISINALFLDTYLIWVYNRASGWCRVHINSSLNFFQQTFQDWWCYIWMKILLMFQIVTKNVATNWLY